MEKNKKFICPYCKKECDTQPFFFTNKHGWEIYEYDEKQKDFIFSHQEWQGLSELRCSVCDKDVSGF